MSYRPALHSWTLAARPGRRAWPWTRQILGAVLLLAAVAAVYTLL